MIVGRSSDGADLWWTLWKSLFPMCLLGLAAVNCKPAGSQNCSNIAFHIHRNSGLLELSVKGSYGSQTAQQASCHDISSTFPLIWAPGFSSLSFLDISSGLGSPWYLDGRHNSPAWCTSWGHWKMPHTQGDMGCVSKLRGHLSKWPWPNPGNP